MYSKKKIHFEISERKVLLRIFDVVFVLLALYGIGNLFDFDYFNISTTNFYWTIVLALYITLFGSVFEIYNLQVASNQFQVVKGIILTASTTVLIYLLTPMFTPVLPSNRLQILYFFFAVIGALLAWRIFYAGFLASTRFEKKAVLVCDKNQLTELVNALAKEDPHYKIIGYVNSDSDSQSEEVVKLKSILPEKLGYFVKKNQVSEIVIASQKTDGITTILYSQLLHLLENGITIREYTQLYETIAHRIPVQFVSRDFYRYFPFSRNNHNKLYLSSIRVMEVLTSIIGLIVGGILVPFIWFGNKVNNKGPLFYTQERVGKNGVVFQIYKFRTMIQNAENGKEAVFAIQNDVRITPFGKFMRKTRIDEFPQFLNILKGDMGVIGPRPERPFFVKQLAKVMPFYETRHVIKPGLTGWAQVNYSYGESIEESLVKLQYDLYYIKHRSIFLDTNIIIKTLSTVLFYRGQ